ncbi:aminotransferase class I/II-fold pyridoxal phosphate-dependent enzyme [Flavobacteriaceae bacterium M23B6Z8]
MSDELGVQSLFLLPMKSLPQKLYKKIEMRKQQNSLRKLPRSISGVDFSSNDYLGFSALEDLKVKSAALLSRYASKNGATGSRLLTGDHSLYWIAESLISEFHQMESALIFNSGYDANIGFFSSVPQKDDMILYDEYIHASIRDGIQMSHARSWKFGHNDLGDLENKIQKVTSENAIIYVVTESIFSMDGDSPHLIPLTACCEKYNCLLIVDEAHALGVMGAEGRGLVLEREIQDKVFASIVTFGKAMGGHGAAVLGSEDLKQYLVNFARSLIYTTGLPPHSVAGIVAAYELLQLQNIHHEKLRDRIAFFKKMVKKNNLASLFINSDSAIHCALIPGVETVKHIANELTVHGYQVKPILAPTVPKGKERLRFCLHSYNSENEISEVLALLATFVNNNL